MANEQYTEKMICRNNRIIIDTATLMEIDALTCFVQKTKSVFVYYGKRILITKAVYSELTKHITSGSTKKRYLAKTVLEIIEENPDLFLVETPSLGSQDTNSVFADSMILADLTINKKDVQQLLITNDRHLSEDAYNLNQQHSCKGHRIFVCYLNQHGELHSCACVKSSVRGANMTESSNVESTLQTEVPDSSEVTNSTGKTTSGFRDFNILSATLGFVAGTGAILLMQGSKKLFNL